VTELTALGDLIPGWPEAAPQDGTELIFADDELLDELGVEGDGRRLVTELRRHVRYAAAARGSSTQLGNAEAVMSALDNGDLRLWWGKWMTLVLDRHRRRVFTTQRRGAENPRTVAQVTGFVPDADKLPRLPEEGTYLLIFGGDQAVLHIDDVRRRLRDLAGRVPVADVIVRRAGRRNESGSPISAPTTWSVRERVGTCGGERVEFDAECRLDELALWG
jgi:hypothetical protein